MAEVAERADELKRQLAHHNHRYYVLDDPEVGDDVYDALLDELRAIERDHPELVTPDSPTQRVGAEPVSRLEKVTHLQPMYSRARGSRTPASSSSPSRRSTASRSRCCTATACSSAAPRAATARWGRTSPTTCAPSPRSRSPSRTGR